MGYKLAGMRVWGGVEIDPKMMELYQKNHNPVYSYLMGVEEFNKIPNEELPWYLFELDILDGSPPCSSFSMNGSRHKKWGSESKFREGQANQVLDDLFFHFINTAKKLKPKIVIAENVKGLISGKAKGYVKEIFQAFKAAEYDCQLFLLNASRMGVPQKRERTFFIAKRKDLELPKIDLSFEEPVVSVLEAFSGLPEQDSGRISELDKRLWRLTKQGGLFRDFNSEGRGFDSRKSSKNQPATTLTASGNLYHFDEPRKFSDSECLRIQSFPDDYDLNGNRGSYVCGMSVPPFMMQRVAYQIRIQWLDKL